MVENEDVPLIRELFYFIKSFVGYFIGKAVTLLRLILAGISSVTYTFSSLKQKLILKLVWKRGVLIRPVSHIGLISLASGVLISGSLLTSGQALGGENRNVGSVNTHTDNGLLLEQSASQTQVPSNRGRDGVVKYTVSSGDTLSSIAQKYNISVDTLSYVNNVRESDILAVGQDLNILPVTGINYKVKSGDTVQGLADEYKIDPQAIVEINWLEKPYALEVDQELILPNAEPPRPVVVLPPVQYAAEPVLGGSSVPTVGSGAFILPAGGTLSRGFGWTSYGFFHNGLDLANSCGTPVYASDAGYVIAGGWRAGGYGLTVWLDHGNGHVTKYAHLSAVSVGEGTYVSRGQLIGQVGNTGNSFGCHLHFMVERGGVAINPYSVL